MGTIRIKLEPHEQEILAQLTEVALSDLTIEISHTDSNDHGNTLKARRRVIQKTLDGLGHPGRRTPARRRGS